MMLLRTTNCAHFLAWVGFSFLLGRTQQCSFPFVWQPCVHILGKQQAVLQRPLKTRFIVRAGSTLTNVKNQPFRLLSSFRTETIQKSKEIPGAAGHQAEGLAPLTVLNQPHHNSDRQKVCSHSVGTNQGPKHNCGGQLVQKTRHWNLHLRALKNPQSPACSSKSATGLISQLPEVPRPVRSKQPVLLWVPGTSGQVHLMRS